MTAALHLSAPVAAGRFLPPTLRTTPGPQIAPLLIGRTPAEALALVGRLYTLCGGAHAAAGTKACEAALGLRPSAAQKAARRVIVLAESLGELALGVLRDWPLVLSHPPRLDAARALRAALAPVPGLLYGGAPWAVPGGAPLTVQHDALAARLADARATVQAEVFGGPAQAMFDHLRAHGLESFGATADLPAGPLARRAHDPRVVPVTQTHGNGLLAHITARLADIAATLDALEDAAGLVYDDSAPAAAPGAATGVAQVEAARGTLIHRVSLTAEGRVAAYAVDAPTDRNFHPAGPLARGLGGAAAGPDGATARHRVALLVAALDPCVACDIEVFDHA